MRMMNQKSFTFHPRYKPKAEQAFGFFSVLHPDISCWKVQLRSGERLAYEKVLQKIQEYKF